MTDLHQLRTVDLSFLDAAPVRFEFAADLPAPATTAFAVISADPSTWTWFPGLSNARYESASPYGVGTKRAVEMNGLAYRETILAWDEPNRWAYRVDESSDSTFAALAEDWVIVPQGSGSQLRWTFAVEPVPELVGIIENARGVIGAVFDEAMASLAVHLTT